MPTAKYSNYLEINPSFESVVDIDADTRNTNLWREYIVGDDNLPEKTHGVSPCGDKLHLFSI